MSDLTSSSGDKASLCRGGLHDTLRDRDQTSLCVCAKCAVERCATLASGRCVKRRVTKNASRCESRILSHTGTAQLGSPLLACRNSDQTKNISTAAHRAVDFCTRLALNSMQLSRHSVQPLSFSSRSSETPKIFEPRGQCVAMR